MTIEPEQLNSWTVDELYRNVHIIRFAGLRAGWRQRVMLTGDRHHDSRMSDHLLQKKHLDKALELNAPIIDIGDFFDIMQGKYDPRRAASELRPEHRGDDYFNQVQDTAIDFFSPYANQFAVLGYGNHERSVLKHNQIDLTKGLVGGLKRASDHNGPFVGGVGGWIIFRFNTPDGHTTALYMKYHHGHGGGGPVTKGVIQTNRRAVYLPDANIVATAHIHESWVVPIKRERLTRRGVQYFDVAWHVSVPTYRDDFDDGFGGFHIDKGRPPKPMGCSWIEFEYGAHNKRVAIKIEQDIV